MQRWSTASVACVAVGVVAVSQTSAQRGSLSEYNDRVEGRAQSRAANSLTSRSRSGTLNHAPSSGRALHAQLSDEAKRFGEMVDAAEAIVGEPREIDSLFRSQWARRISGPTGSFGPADVPGFTTLSPVAGAWGGVASIGKALGRAGFVAESLAYIHNGDYHMPFVEWVRGAVARAVPAVGLTDTLFSGFDAFSQGVPNGLMPRGLRDQVGAFNPVDAFGKGLDVIGTIASSQMPNLAAMSGGVLPTALERLHGRLNTGATKPFVELGEAFWNQFGRGMSNDIMSSIEGWRGNRGQPAPLPEGPLDAPALANGGPGLDKPERPSDLHIRPMGKRADGQGELDGIQPADGMTALGYGESRTEGGSGFGSGHVSQGDGHDVGSQFSDERDSPSDGGDHSGGGPGGKGEVEKPKSGEPERSLTSRDLAWGRDVGPLGTAELPSFKVRRNHSNDAGIPDGRYNGHSGERIGPITRSETGQSSDNPFIPGGGVLGGLESRERRDRGESGSPPAVPGPSTSGSDQSSCPAPRTGIWKRRNRWGHEEWGRFCVHGEEHPGGG